MTPDRPRVVIVSHLCPFPPVHGNRSRLIGLLEWLRANGIAVTFILQPLDVEGSEGLSRLRDLVDRLEVVRARGIMQSAVLRMKRVSVGLAGAVVSARLRRLLGRLLRRRLADTADLREGWGSGDMGGDGHIDRWCWPATCRAVERAVRRDRPSAVLAEYALLSKCLQGLPHSVLKAIDTVEVFFRNRERFQVAGLKAPLVCSPESETEALARADLLIAIQKNDAQALQERFPSTRVITVPHTYPQIPRHHDGPQRGTVLYVGSSNPFNVHGLREFIIHAWPTILTHVPTATMRILGSVPKEDHPGATRIVHVGRVSDAVLANEYQSAHVVINPQVAGTGLKIKCVEALSAGCPLVLNRAGADGLEDGEGRAFLVAKDWREFAGHVVDVLTDDRLRLGLEERAREFARERFAPTAVFSPLAEALATRQVR
jgi:glycosyltransferase involved in cell wall biosynthesis